MIAIYEGRLVLSVGDKNMIFKLPEAMRHTSDHVNTSYFVNDAFDCIQEVLSVDSLEEFLGEPSNDVKKIPKILRRHL